MRETGRQALAVFAKELVDALRDRRTLATVLLSSVAMGPLVLVLISSLVGNLERRAEARVVRMQGAEQAPTLVNYLERQTYTVRAAEADHEQRLKSGALGDPVVVVIRRKTSALVRKRRSASSAGRAERVSIAPLSRSTIT